MATEVDWNSNVFNGTGGKGKTNFLKFSPGKTVIFRPVGKAVTFAKFFVNGRSVVVDIADKDKAQEILSQEAGQEVTGTIRYAINVIDREDNKIKVLEGGNSIFKQFANWAKAANTHPGGNGGGNWTITAEGSGQNRRYNTTFVKNVPFTADEVKRLKNESEDKELYTLKDIFKATPVSEVVQKAYGERKAGGGNAGSEPEPESAPQGGDDLGFAGGDEINF